MTVENNRLSLPPYDDFVESISGLSLSCSASELHGMMCAYLCAGANSQGEAYLRALLNNKKDASSRNAALAMFAVYAVSQQQITGFDFEFEMMLPDDNATLIDRAQAFSEWCEGFTHGLTLSGINSEQFYEEEAQEALQHIIEFSELECEYLDVDEEDEKALVEVSEYTRMAVLRLHGDLVANEKERDNSETTH